MIALRKKDIKGVHKIRISDTLLPQIPDRHDNRRKEWNVILEERKRVVYVAIIEDLVKERVHVVAQGLIVMKYMGHTIGITLILFLYRDQISLFVKLDRHGKIVGS